MTNEELKTFVRLARELHLGGRTRHARPGDLVVEISKFNTDPDAIGWLVAHGRAPYERTPPLHVGDCPMTNSDKAARTRCICDRHDDVPCECIEGGGGQRYSGSTREIWDVVPLSNYPRDSLRWENAEFVALPDSVAELAREAFPKQWNVANMHPHRDAKKE